MPFPDGLTLLTRVRLISFLMRFLSSQPEVCNSPCICIFCKDAWRRKQVSEENTLLPHTIPVYGHALSKRELLPHSRQDRTLRTTLPNASLLPQVNASPRGGAGFTSALPQASGRASWGGRAGGTRGGTNNASELWGKGSLWWRSCRNVMDGPVGVFYVLADGACSFPFAPAETPEGKHGTPG